MKCLRCETVEMDIETRGEGTQVFETDVCPSCRGFWLDQKELNQLDDNMFVDLEDIDFKDVCATDEDQTMMCPRCADTPTLRKVTPDAFPGVVIDTCPLCKGFWLDRGELEKMSLVSDKLLIASLADDV